MAIILDADVVIRGEKGSFDLNKWVASLPNERFEIAAITVAELSHGVERATGKHKRPGAVLKSGFGAFADYSLYGADGV